ncbi:MAG TPA: Na+/H+ antiporter NhaA [Nitrospirota bacterium]|nr:Na+/H+ antiporter NhaA [Nitrospirota bacterium]
MTDSVKEFLKLESAGGILLIGATILALVAANSPVVVLYNAFLDTPVEMRVGSIQVAKPALLWINDGLMAIFFFLIGLELKREFLEGELSSLRQVALPAFGALGGMVVPVAVFVAINYGDAVYLRGWAIPAATDIAFALGVMAMLGSRVPVSLKVFLTSLAIFDDVGAILIIAFFYTEELTIAALLFACVLIISLFILNRLGVSKRTPYIIIGIALWVAVLKSGIHATIAGVILAFFIPLRTSDANGSSPLRELENDLHATVSYGILPLFAFANAGISLAGVRSSSLLYPLPLGIAAGLFLGKQVGVFLFSFLAVKMGIAHPLESVGWKTLYGVAILCGIGFTMSLFISSLAFEPGTLGESVDERIGILTGSFLSAIIGYVILDRSLPDVKV